MQKANPPIRKSDLRQRFLLLRNAIPQNRREAASQALIEPLRDRGRILTFYSIGMEIDLSLLNSMLVKLGWLMANRLEQGKLVPYHIGHEQDLLISPLGIPEPNPSVSQKVDFAEIDLILVPALAFDREGYRLGYGKGYYDKLLATTGDIATVGIGFQEQLSIDLLPRDPWDIPVKELILV